MENNYINVCMNEIKITDSNNKIIGTYALATCVGVLLYSEEHKTALVAHVSDKPERNFAKILCMLEENNLLDSEIKYAVIQGYYYNNYKLYENLCALFEENNDLFIPLDYKKGDIEVEEDLPAHGFMFDAEVGEFVNSKNNRRSLRNK